MRDGADGVQRSLRNGWTGTHMKDAKGGGGRFEICSLANWLMISTTIKCTPTSLPPIDVGVAVFQNHDLPTLPLRVSTFYSTET